MKERGQIGLTAVILIALAVIGFFAVIKFLIPGD